MVNHLALRKTFPGKSSTKGMDEESKFRPPDESNRVHEQHKNV